MCQQILPVWNMDLLVKNILKKAFKIRYNQQKKVTITTPYRYLSGGFESIL